VRSRKGLLTRSAFELADSGETDVVVMLEFEGAGLARGKIFSAGMGNFIV